MVEETIRNIDARILMNERCRSLSTRVHRGMIEGWRASQRVSVRHAPPGETRHYGSPGASSSSVPLSDFATMRIMRELASGHEHWPGYPDGSAHPAAATQNVPFRDSQQPDLCSHPAHVCGTFLWRALPCLTPFRGGSERALSPVSTNGTDLRLWLKEGWGFVVVTKERR